MVAEATAPLRENVPRHILFYFIGKTAYGALLNDDELDDGFGEEGFYIF